MMWMGGNAITLNIWVIHQIDTVKPFSVLKDLWHIERSVAQPPTIIQSRFAENPPFRLKKNLSAYFFGDKIQQLPSTGNIYN